MVHPAGPPPLPQEEPTKRCPFCAERILQQAIKCRFCGSSLVEGNPQQHSSAFSRKSTDFGMVLALAPWIGTVLLFAWVQTGMLMSAWQNWSITMVIVDAGCAVFAAIDASHLEMGTKPHPRSGKKHDGPIGVFFAILLAWFVAYPVYMWRRRGYASGRSWASLGLVSWAVCLTVALYTAYLIDASWDNLRVSLRQLG